ncbi:sigma-E processing peptidase SpoIIGA [Bacillus timonensis]|nr:sigma-E processing peptidase SpoIIGA [Bacillus timonensis]
MTIYLDVIWLLNLLFDGLLLVLTAKILKREYEMWRLVLGAFIGSSIVLLMMSPMALIISNPLVKVAYSFLIVGTAFGYKRFRYFMQGVLTFYFVTFALGGGMVGVHYFLQYEIEFANGTLLSTPSGFGHPVSWLFVFLGFPIIWIFSRNQIEEIEMKKIHYDQIVKVTIQIDGRLLYLNGLIDSGNQLYDPISKNPVMILDLNKVCNFFPESMIEQAKDINNLSNELVGDAHPWESRIRIVPYRAVGQDHQFLLAIKPDQVVIDHSDEKIVVKKVLIALNTTQLSSDDEYECIIHPKMLLSSTTTRSAS